MGVLVNIQVVSKSDYLIDVYFDDGKIVEYDAKTDLESEDLHCKKI